MQPQPLFGFVAPLPVQVQSRWVDDRRRSRKDGSNHTWSCVVLIAGVALLLSAYTDGRFHTVVRCFVEAIFREQGISLTDFIAKYGCGINGGRFGVFAQGLPIGSETWDAVEERGEDAEAVYWKSNIYLSQADANLVARAVGALLRYDQVAMAGRTLAYTKCAASSEVILEALKRVPVFLNEYRDTRTDNFAYRIERMFKMLDANGDVSNDQLVQLEIAFLPLLEHTNRKFPAIVRYARENPEFFVELLRLQFRRRDGEEDEDLKAVSNERRKQLFDVAFDILREFDAIPGLDGAEPRAAQHMRWWISQVLQAAAQVGRREIAEEKIGGALARAPASEGEPWPPDHVCDIIEEFWSERLATGLHCGCVNKLGFRSIDAGEPDKALAEQYRGWATYRHITHPHVSVFLNQLSKHFTAQARCHALDAEVRRQIDY